MEVDFVFDFTEDIHIIMMKFLPANDLLRLQCSCKFFAGIDTNNIWSQLCESRFRNWFRYRNMYVKEHIEQNWKKRYTSLENDSSRTTITASELMELDWHFNFTPEAGGRKEETLQSCKFSNFLELNNFPLLHYSLLEDASGANSNFLIEEEVLTRESEGEFSDLYDNQDNNGILPVSDRQVLMISNFPPHFISRLRSSGQWIIFNRNVTFVSGQHMDFKKRGFCA